MFKDRRRSASLMPLYDVTDQYNRALSKARLQRGEPDAGMARKIYEVRQSLQVEHLKSRVKSKQGGLALTLVSVGLVAAYVMRAQKRNSAEGGLSQQQAA